MDNKALKPGDYWINVTMMSQSEDNDEDDDWCLDIEIPKGNKLSICEINNIAHKGAVAALKAAGIKITGSSN